MAAIERFAVNIVGPVAPDGKHVVTPADKAVAKEEWRPPVWLVATHRDLWRPDIPLDTLRKQFPRVRFLGMLEISNKTRKGASKVTEALRTSTAELPLMGKAWPRDWQKAEDAIHQRIEKKESRMTVQDLWSTLC